MKIRIRESQLKQIIRESIYELDEPTFEKPAVEKAKKKVVNKTKDSGTFKQIYQGDAYAYDYNLPQFAVVVKNVQDELIANKLQRMIGLSPIGEYYLRVIRKYPEINKLFTRIWERDKNGTPITEEGFKIYENLINNIYNQICKSNKFTEEYDSSVRLTPEEDPFKETYGPKSPHCPFEIMNGMVVPKEETEDYVDQYFDRYTADDAIFWDLATYHDDGSYIFFFWDVVKRNDFTRQLKNLFMIANHYFDKPTGLFYYTFIQQFNPHIQIIQVGGGTYDGWKGANPRDLLTDEDSDLLTVISKLEEIQQDDENQRQLELTPEYRAQKAKEEEEKRERLANMRIAAFAPTGLYDNTAVSAPQKIGGTGSVDGLAESKLKRMIKESIRKAMKNR